LYYEVYMYYMFVDGYWVQDRALMVVAMLLNLPPLHVPLTAVKLG
jgi:hypothetical protein